MVTTSLLSISKFLKFGSIEIAFLFHSAEFPDDLPKLLYISLVCSFLLLNIIPLV